MPITAAYIVPHPPLILPEVGKGEERKIQRTIDAYRTAAREIVAVKPDVIVVSPPHAVSYADYIHIAPGPSAEGDFTQFGQPEVRVRARYDEALSEALAELCRAEGFPGGLLGQKSPKLDHGFMVPWYFISQEGGADIPCLRVSISGLSAARHYAFGVLLQKTLENLDKRAVFVASGDLSHKLTEEGPYGFDAMGPAFDQKITAMVESADFLPLFEFTEGECRRAGECGLRSFQMMVGALDGLRVSAALLSYEGPFGVGYAVGRFRAEGTLRDPARQFLLLYEQRLAETIRQIRAEESPYAALARQGLTSYLQGKDWDAADLARLPTEMLTQKAGVFVSIKKEGQLRGCIGTIAPACQNIAEEIIMNAISAGTRDERFSPVTPDELDSLVYSVDVLGPPERVYTPEDLDVTRYGVIVTAGRKRGLLLPNLEGVTTVAEQLSIAYQKGGISPEEDVVLERFEVVRYR